MNIPLKIGQREKKFLIAGGIIVFLIFAYQFGVWYKNFRVSSKEYIESRQITLQKQLNKILQKANIKNNFEAADAELKELEKGLVSGDTPPVAAAEIQRNLKVMAMSLGIDIKSEKALNSVDSGLYLSIPVEIGFTAPTAKLKDMLYKIKTSPLLLTVPKIKSRVVNVNNPTDVFTTLTVEGLIIKKPQQAEGDKKGIKNAP